MAERQQIEFVIRPDGSVEERVTGISGPDCEKVTGAIEKALGDVTRRVRTPDYYNPQQQSDSDTVANRS